ncbi:MAG: PAS domain S-box protein, partial [Alphaproteobacteria bacterium]|nr:PAS domain S-box protein [Alphaproteobacteria bacterium]
LFPTLNDWMFGIFAFVQTAVAVALRGFFRESRSWGVRYRQLLSATSAAVTVSDAQGRIHRPHPELEKLLGMPWPAYAGTGWLTAIHPEDRKLMTPANAGETHRAEVRLKDPHDGSWRWHMMRAVPLTGANGEPEEWVSMLTDIHDRKLLAEQREVTIGEARHRLKNLITIIESLAKSSRPPDKDPAVEAFLEKYLGRLRALTAASDLALASNYSMMQAEDVARATLAPFLERETGRITIGGPKLELSEAMGGGLAMGLNELATNAIKYGSLSVPSGRVTWSWTVTPENDQDRVVMEWREEGGPPPMPPAKEGYGARVIRFIGSRATNGKVEMLYPPEGYICRIEFTRPHKARVPTPEGD